MEIEVREYLESGGRSPFGRWFARLNPQAAAKVSTSLHRLGQGNFSNVESVGRGVYEYKLDFGPGYRLYFGRDGQQIVIMLAGGTKRRKSQDIRVAMTRWQDYKRRR